MSQINRIVQYLSFWNWLFFLTWHYGRKFHLRCSLSQNFLPFKGWTVFHCIYTCFADLFFFMKGLLGCFRVLAIVNNAMNMGVTSLGVSAFNSFGYKSRKELLDHMVILLLFFWGTAILFYSVAVPLYIAINSAQGVQYFHIFTSTCFLFFFLFFHSSHLNG